MSQQVLVRMPEDLHEELSRQAADLGIDRAEFVRDTLERAFAERRARPTPRISEQDRAALASLATVVGRATGALMEAARRMQDAGGSPLLILEARSRYKEFRPLLDELRQLLAGLKR